MKTSVICFACQFLVGAGLHERAGQCGPDVDTSLLQLRANMNKQDVGGPTVLPDMEPAVEETEGNFEPVEAGSATSDIAESTSRLELLGRPTKWAILLANASKMEPETLVMPIILIMAGITLAVGLFAFYRVTKQEHEELAEDCTPMADERLNVEQKVSNKPRDLANGNLAVPDVPYGQGSFHQLSWSTWDGNGDGASLTLLDLHDQSTCTALGRFGESSKQMKFLAPSGNAWATVQTGTDTGLGPYARLKFLDERGQYYAEVTRKDAAAEIRDVNGSHVYSVIGGFENPELLKGNGVIQVVHVDDGRVAAQCEVDARSGTPRCYCIVKAKEDLGLITACLVALADIADLWNRVEALSQQSQ
eukprot:CAMPEP_0204270582 /NCGR_PEP_ID=MMETSP0468-20130131/18974_1 /ASSEMBLY_ACC=CAM_ASM_000383 /TAXON_ID=2969 /ORGANISM="Oxyrrhis marina" /LENGTH=361 /DNA_ID=CAMNT_0051246135 /DNA_START=49 /DNA_END=1134 /DNA_ORIENTATION=+